MSKYKGLSDVVIDALKLHSSYKLPMIKLGKPGNRLIVASGNAVPTAKIVFNHSVTIIEDEGQYQIVLKENKSIKTGVVLSASGTKHAPIIIKDLLKRKINAYLLTCDKTSPAAKLLPKSHIVETKSNVEPITYNTSTYLGMILAKTREDPTKILNHIQKRVKKSLKVDLKNFKSFYIIIPPEFDILKEMLLTKFDELFGGKVNGRCYTSEQTKHAKTVVPSKDELFISIGFENKIFGDKSARWNISLFKGADFASIIAIGYYAIGLIQKNKPPYFMKNAEKYSKIQKEDLFDKKFFDSGMSRYLV